MRSLAYCFLQKIAKRKKIHAFKSKARQEQLEVTQNKKQNAWQQFQTTKAKTKKVLKNIRNLDFDRLSFLAL